MGLSIGHAGAIYICTGPSLVGDLPPSIPCDQLAPPPKEAVVEQSHGIDGTNAVPCKSPGHAPGCSGGL